MKKQNQGFTLLPFNNKLAYAQISNPHCIQALVKSRRARTREDLSALREEIRNAGIEQGVWPLTVALDMKLSGNEIHATRIAPEVRGVVDELFKLWQAI